MNETILLIEDNESIIMGLEYLLTEEQYTFLAAKTKKEAQDLLASRQVDLVLLDVSLPDGNGFDLCRKIKEHDIAPVIFLTAKDEEKDVVLGFDLGADDYVKPFRNRELVSRIRNVLRRTEKIRRLTCGNIAVEPDTGKVYRDGEPIAVTKLEYKILMTLFSNPHKIFTREEILNGIWDMAGNFVNDNTLSVYIKRLRDKLEMPGHPLISTVRGMGYRLEVDGHDKK